MSLTLDSITFDCDDALAVATFWSAALDMPIDPDGSAEFASIGRRRVGAADTERGCSPRCRKARRRRTACTST